MLRAAAAAAAAARAAATAADRARAPRLAPPRALHGAGAAEAHAMLAERAGARPLLAASLYVSAAEGAALRAARDALSAAAAHAPRAAPALAVLAELVDAPYSRTGFTVCVDRSAGGDDALALLALELARACERHIDLRAHEATHPRLGALDHIYVSPLGASTLAEAADAARLCAEAVAGVGVPVAAYGALSPNCARLAAVRRRLGYFKGSKRGTWRGAATDGDEPFSFDFGPRAAHPSQGICCVGAVEWVVNYNVPLATDDLELARRCARAVSERGGGLPRVEAAGLPHGNGAVEVACNLLDHDGADGSDSPSVQAFVEDYVRARRPGVAVGKGYNTNPTPQELLVQASVALGGG